jgi:hypothetical protein
MIRHGGPPRPRSRRARSPAACPPPSSLRCPAGRDPLPGPNRGFLGYRRVYRAAELPADPAAGRSACCAALVLGGSAPDALRHGLKGVGQAVCPDGATAADCLRRLDLPYRRACRRRNGKEQIGIDLTAGAARNPAQGACPGRYPPHLKSPAGACIARGMATPPAARLSWLPGSGAAGAPRMSLRPSAASTLAYRHRGRGMDAGTHMQRRCMAPCAVAWQ